MPADALEAARSYAPRLPPDSWFSHVTAAALWGLPLPLRFLHPKAPVHVTTRSADRSIRGRGVVGHRSVGRGALAVRSGLPLSHPVATWVELAPLLSVDELIRMGDALVDPHRSGLTRDDLALACRQAVGRRGCVNLRRAFAEVREGSRSPAETDLRLAITRGGLPMPFLNVDVHTARGRFLGQPDLTYGLARLVIEYEGDHHRTDVATFRSDIERRERFEDEGWRVLRVTGGDARQRFVRAIERIGRLLCERRPR